MNIKKNYKRLQGLEWQELKDKLKPLKYIKNKNGNIKGFYKDKEGNNVYTHWLNDEEINNLYRKESGKYE